uniref:AAA+ ATPase domain-containing protein n=1 Tax=Kalanchoe fedtschenkoi TaxID=63787 RepID=A0A7N0RFT8_KALFE
MEAVREYWIQISSAIASFMFVWATLQDFYPIQMVRYQLERVWSKVEAYFDPYVHIRFNEYIGYRRSEAFAAIETYLGSKSISQAKELKGHVVKHTQNLVLTMGEAEDLREIFRGRKLWWASRKTKPEGQAISFYPQSDTARRYYKLTFRKEDREVVTGEYLSYVLEQGKAMQLRSQQRRLYTNNPSSQWYDCKKNLWSHVAFQHPSTFDTVAMDSAKKAEIVKDLTAFSEGREYYERVGKAWKRGYLLHGPPGTGKSTMIAAIANFMKYDIYDLELTAVMDNMELRKLLTETSSKSIIVIEDIDCSIDLTGDRKKKRSSSNSATSAAGQFLGLEKAGSNDQNESKVTLSGLLNFIDGLWSACGSERIIIFTTNHLDRLDPALIRRGRMDLHIEMSYCTFEAFKVLAKNYTGLESHALFDKIGRMLPEVEMSPADVAEQLMARSKHVDADECLGGLVRALEAAKIMKGKKQREERSGRSNRPLNRIRRILGWKRQKSSSENKS